jgi:hypothetical protein
MAVHCWAKPSAQLANAGSYSDGSIFPQLGAKDLKTGWFENQETIPDQLVYNEPDAIKDGRDPQLEAAVAELLKAGKGR